MTSAVKNRQVNMRRESQSRQNKVRNVRLFGIPIQASRMCDAVQRVDQAVASGQSLDIGVVNAAKIVNMKKDPELRQAVLSADVIYADGMSVVWASRILGDSLPERVAGIDLMHEILDHGQEKGYRVYCLGATQEVVDEVCKIFGQMYPGIVIAGSRNGYFGPDEEEQIAHSIHESRPDVLFVAMTSPKKERFLARWSSVMKVPVTHGVGGSFDVVAGLVERAPESWQRLGLEWLYRVKQEPRRLWKRYLTTNLVFLGYLIAEKFSRLTGGVTGR